MARNITALLLLPILAQIPLAEAQVALPSVRLPSLPSVGLPVDVDRTVSDLSGDLDPRRVEDLRRLHIRELLRTHSKEVEADPKGAPILRGEVVAFAPSDAALDAARAAGFSVSRERVLEGLDTRIVVLAAPSGWSTRRALKRLKELSPEGAYDFNHLYTDSGQVGTESPTHFTARRQLRIYGPEAPGGERSALGVGLIDSGVDTAHPVFHDIVIHQHGCAGAPVPAAHGTAVASLMIGRTARFHGAAAGSDLYAADVYCGLATGGAVDAVADALAWFVRERVPVINVSLVGPANVMLENVVRLVVSRGHIVVAAVGNDGPAAPPLYPAAYPDVVGVTAVDARQHVLLEACRGPQVKFSAPGADMAAADASNGFASVRGTSFAAPIVAGLLAQALREPDKAAAASAVSDLAHHAIDLGAPGPDPVYGFGLVGGELRPQLASLQD